MLKNSILASAMALILAASLASPSEAANKNKKTPKKNQQYDANGLQSPEQGQFDRSGGNNSNGGTSGGGNSSSSDSNNAYGGGNSDGNSSGNNGSGSVSMFKAGNTSLPSGTYAMTNVSTGAAFVVIVDDSGDMRAQDARAMNLIDDSKSAKGSPQSNLQSNSTRNNNGSSYNDSSYDDSQYSASRYGNSDYSGAQSGNSKNYNSSGSSGGSPPLLTPEPTPASAILPTPMKGHPLLQGVTQGNIFSQAGGSMPNLYSQQNPLMQGQPPVGQFSGGIKGALQAELQRQLGKQLMKHGPQIEQEVRKVIQKFN